MYTLILFSLNILLTTSKFQPFEIICNLRLIVYILYMTHRYVYILYMTHRYVYIFT